jgi:hypothetical protein
MHLRQHLTGICSVPIYLSLLVALFTRFRISIFDTILSTYTGQMPPTSKCNIY